MHFAKIEKSTRLQKFVKLLSDGRARTTREIISATGLCAINSIAAECRENGIDIDCRFRERTLDGGRVYEYQLRGLNDCM